MRRRLEAPGGFNIWPAFTDLLGGLVVVLVFLITIFVIGEFLIGREMIGKNTAIGQLQKIIEHLEDLVGESEDQAQQLRQQISHLQTTVTSQEVRLSQLQEELNTTRAAYVDLDQEKTQTEQKASMLSARTEHLVEELEQLKLALSGSEKQLAVANTELAQRDTLIGEQQERLEAMDRLIKRRLLERVEELEKYASDFFGRLREVFAGNPDIKVVGDRFVFQSEVLFGSGEAMLSQAGKADLDKFVKVYSQVAEDLPKDLPVIIEVQGHTDRMPIHTPRFRSNWELSTQRALDVVNYLIEQGIPPRHLAAVGMGEYHPLDPAVTAEAYRRNRRIELKITSR